MIRDPEAPESFLRGSPSRQGRVPFPVPALRGGRSREPCVRARRPPAPLPRPGALRSPPDPPGGRFCYPLELLTVSPETDTSVSRVLSSSFERSRDWGFFENLLGVELFRRPLSRTLSVVIFGSPATVSSRAPYCAQPESPPGVVLPSAHSFPPPAPRTVQRLGLVRLCRQPALWPERALPAKREFHPGQA